ncbi:hypothetical protein [Nannocystis punicea]|uniref:Tetratricopeptide repeat protein n=1 Tax=Nannocystis punicea TaxID=2995304 RepID=A0ABY7HEV1_9BACT|nr:hypothetical protein [Nannocystis poenicansa]WAS97814.1 hypothetical protein O0S08_16865 [Nannocystis poenicansa]
MAAVPAPPEPLTDDEQRMLAQGRHEALAHALALSGRHAAAGWVLEQIWEFAGACEHYARAGRPLDALRAAIELGRPDVLDRIIAVFAAADADTRQQAAALLQRKGRHADAARILALGDHDPEARARALVRAGDRLGAARVLADADRVREALALLEPLPERHGPTLQLAAELSWELGDAEAAVRRAQAAIRAGGADRAALSRLLARGLGALGHDLAAQIVLQGRGEAPEGAPVPARFLVRASLPASFLAPPTRAPTASPSPRSRSTSSSPSCRRAAPPTRRSRTRSRRSTAGPPPPPRSSTRRSAASSSSTPAPGS